MTLSNTIISQNRQATVLIAVVTFLLLVLLAGCERHIESKDPVRSLPGEPPAPVNVVASLADRSVRLTWEVSDSSNVVRFRIYRSPAGEEDYTLHDSTTSYTRLVSGLPLNQAIDLQVRAVSDRGVEGRGSAPVSVIVALLSITVSNNDEYTNSRNVQIQLNAPSTVEYVELSEDSTFAGSSPVPFSAQRSFTLSPTDGVKRVFARFTFEDGSMSDGVIADNIILDQYARVNDVYFAPLTGAFTTGDTIQFFVDADGEIGGEATVSFGSVNDLLLNDGGVSPDVAADDGIYSGRYVVPIQVTMNGAEVRGTFTDAAGNVADGVSSTPLNIEAAPLAVQISSVDAISSWQIQVRWTQSGSGDFASYRLYRATTNSVSDASTLITTVNSASTVTYTDTTVDATTEYFYVVYVVDGSGLRTPSNVDSATTPANTAPRAVTVAASLQDSTNARITWTRNEDDDFSSYRIYRDISPNVSVADDLITIISERGSLTYTDYVPFPSGSETYYYRVMVYDRQGLMTPSNEVQVSR